MIGELTACPQDCYAYLKVIKLLVTITGQISKFEF